MLTLKRVNRELQKLDPKIELVRNDEDEYFYFSGNVDNWFETMVVVARINHLTLDQWIEEYHRLKKD